MSRVSHNVSYLFCFSHDAVLYLEIAAGTDICFEVKDGRQAYLLAVESDDAVVKKQGGSADTCEEVKMLTHDAAKLHGPLNLTMTADKEPASFLVVEMAQA